MRENRVFVLLLLLILVGGSVLRFWSIGSSQLKSSELAYHFAAQSIAGGAAPSLPSGEELRRGLPMARVVSALQGSLRDAETAARIPSALLGTAALILFAGVMWLIAGPVAAVAATFLFAFYPEAIRQSRTAGLYSFQQFCGVIALGAGWLATVQSLPQQKSTLVDLVRRWIWAGVTCAAFAMAGLAHLSAGTVFVAYATWVLLLAVMAFWLTGPRAILSNLAAQLVAAGILAAVAVVVLKPEVWGAIQSKVATAPDDARVSTNSFVFYAETFGSQFGWAFTLLPLIVLFTFRKYTWLTVYLVLWFAVPLVEHSAFIARREERFLLLAAPALFALCGLALSEGRDTLARAINVHAREWLPSYRAAVRTAEFMAWGVFLFALISLPSFANSLRQPLSTDGTTRSDWTAVRRVLESAPNAEDLPLGSSDALVGIQNLGRSDFTIAANLAEQPAPALGRQATGRFPPATDSIGVERWSGAVVASTFGAIRNAYVQYGEVHIVFDVRDVESGLIDRGLRESLDQKGAELCHGQCGTLRLYRLRLIEEAVKEAGKEAVKEAGK